MVRNLMLLSLTAALWACGGGDVAWPPLPTAPRATSTPTNAEQVRGLIDALQGLDLPDFGLSGTFSGERFSPAGVSEGAVMILGDHRLGQAAPMEELVRLGPSAIQALLAALTDARPTALVIQSEGFLQGVRMDLDGNLNHDLSFPDGSILPYTVTVGDAAFTALGEITGRGYAAVSYVPSGLVGITSPVGTPSVAQEVRRSFDGDDPRTTLYDEFRAGYVRHEPDAIMRLLFYFPSESARSIARLVSLLDLRYRSDLDDWRAREDKNGARTEDILAAIAWGPESAVREAVRGAAMRTDDPTLFIAAASGLGTWDLATARHAASLVEVEPPLGDGYYTDSVVVLALLTRNAPDVARPLCEAYLTTDTVARRRALIAAVGQGGPAWGPQVLRPLLDDTSTYGWTYDVVAGQSEPRLPRRICDDAAEAIAAMRPDLPFDRHGTHVELDAQIERMKAGLDAEP